MTGLAISAGCAVPGAFQGSRTVLRLQPAAAMRPKPPREGKAVLLAALFWLLAHLAVQRQVHRMDWLEALKVSE